MSIGAVVTRGYSNGTFAFTIAEVVTRGYTIGEEAEVAQGITPAGGDDAPRRRDDDTITRGELYQLELERAEKLKLLAEQEEAERLALLANNMEEVARAGLLRRNTEIMLLLLDDEIRRKAAVKFLMTL